MLFQKTGLIGLFPTQRRSAVSTCGICIVVAHHQNLSTFIQNVNLMFGYDLNTFICKKYNVCLCIVDILRHKQRLTRATLTRPKSARRHFQNIFRLQKPGFLESWNISQVQLSNLTTHLAGFFHWQLDRVSFPNYLIFIVVTIITIIIFIVLIILIIVLVVLSSSSSS